MSDEQIESVPFDFSLAIGSEVLNFNGRLPIGPCSTAELMPLILAVGQGILDTVERQIDDGKKVSCGPGCGACCRQLVPVSDTEAVYLRSMVIPGLDPEHRERVEKRIEAAKTKLLNDDLMDSLKALPNEKDAEKRQSLGLRYFVSAIACPFLENESCSIHPKRPLACREYLVTSPAKCCSKPSDGEVAPVRLPIKPSHALIRLDAESFGSAGWQTMITALAANSIGSDEIVDHPVDLIKTFISKLS